MDNTDFQKRMGERMRSIRNERKISIRELCLLTGLDESHMARTETGYVDPKVGTLRKIAEALNCDIKDFL
ncbi:helix-turn-helix transcriptional regulator [Roseivirga sp. UBA838]|uniref:helix-turn-helix domain-containing protein n=1 Tax=Roseivirga sp. UBA838 TaxID=1947393 RepID=UPI002580F72A|nr:helix-turn-helix transcriptional regulator [Roseivirga sp. UBA838]|tara:strand:- start:2826 stop:3035 length:210 start_codon:yes stop_codon:yes gene_type:complete